MELSKYKRIASRLVTAWVLDYPELYKNPPRYTKGWIQEDRFYCMASIGDDYVIHIIISEDVASLDIYRYDHDLHLDHVDKLDILFPEAC